MSSRHSSFTKLPRSLRPKCKAIMLSGVLLLRFKTSFCNSTMAKDFRSKRLEELIKEKLSALLLKGLKDPRLEAFITVLDVTLAGDGRSARVIVSVLGSEQEKKAALKGLESARGYIQMRLGKEIKVKYIPHLRFLLDDKTEERVRFVHWISEMEKKGSE
jgi:ribosome-binding factor A